MTDLIGWRAAFDVVALLTLAAAIIVALTLTRERHFVRSGGFAASPRHMLRHLRDPRLIATYAIGFGVLFNFIATFTYVSFHLAAPPYLFSPTLLGALFFTYLGSSVVVPWVGRGIALFGRRRFVLGIIAAVVGRRALAAGAARQRDHCRADAVRGLRHVVPDGATGYVTMTAKEGRSSAVGLYASIYYIGGSAGAFFTGLAWTVAGLAGLRRNHCRHAGDHGGHRRGCLGLIMRNEVSPKGERRVVGEPIRISAVDRHADRLQPDRDRGARTARRRLYRSTCIARFPICRRWSASPRRSPSARATR